MAHTLVNYREDKMVTVNIKTGYIRKLILKELKKGDDEEW